MLRDVLECRVARLAALDLSQIKRKLVQPIPNGCGWTEAQAAEGEVRYRAFLHLVIFGKQPVPDLLTDGFWHQHILDTRKYQIDCREVLGFFLDHDPYFGMNGDLAERDAAYAQTQADYGKYFDTLAFTTPAMCGSTGDRAAMCGSTGPSSPVELVMQ